MAYFFSTLITLKLLILLALLTLMTKSMARFFLIISLGLFLTAHKVHSQEMDRPVISKKEAKRFQKGIKKFNQHIEQQAQRLKELIKNTEDSLAQNTQIGPSIDNVILAPMDSIHGDEILDIQTLETEKYPFDSLNLPTELSDEVNKLRKELKVGMQLSKADPKLANQLEDAYLNLSETEYSLDEIDQLTSKLQALQINQKDLNKYVGSISTDFSEFRDKVKTMQGSLDTYKSQLVNWDETLERQIMRLEEVNGLSEYQNRDVDVISQTKGLQNELEGFQSKAFVQNQLEQRFAKLIENEGEDALVKRLTKGHEKLGELKQKYSDLQDSGKPFARKENPMKGKDFFERTELGGNFQVNRSKPVTVDAGLELAYKLSGNAEVGIGSAYRLRMESVAKANFPTDVLNFKSFYHHTLFGNLGLQANYEMNYALPINQGTNEQLSKEWKRAGLAGVRLEQNLFKGVKGYITIQYDFLNNASSVNPRWLIRFGFRL